MLYDCHMRRDEQGFIIFDAMIAMLIMGVALLVLGLLISSNQRNQVRSVQRNQSTLDLVEREVQTVRRLGWSAVTLQGEPACAAPTGQNKQWCLHRGKVPGGQAFPGAASGGVLAIGSSNIGKSDYDVYRYVYCLNANGSAAAASVNCPVKRVRIVVEAKGQGLARRLPPDGIAYRDLVMTQTLYKTPVN